MFQKNRLRLTLVVTLFVATFLSIAFTLGAPILGAHAAPARATFSGLANCSSSRTGTGWRTAHHGGYVGYGADYEIRVYCNGSYSYVDRPSAKNSATWQFRGGSDAANPVTVWVYISGGRGGASRAIYTYHDTILGYTRSFTFNQQRHAGWYKVGVVNVPGESYYLNISVTAGKGSHGTLLVDAVGLAE